jgi:hypothetical protein
MDESGGPSGSRRDGSRRRWGDYAVGVRRCRRAARTAAETASAARSTISHVTGATADAEAAGADPKLHRGAPGSVSRTLAAVRVRARGGCVLPVRDDPAADAAPFLAPARSRARTGAGSVPARVGPLEPGVCGPPALGMSSQYWFWALAPALEQGAPGALDGYSAPGWVATAAPGAISAAANVPARSRSNALPGRVCRPCRPRKLTLTGDAS